MNLSRRGFLGGLLGVAAGQAVGLTIGAEVGALFTAGTIARANAFFKSNYGMDGELLGETCAKSADAYNKQFNEWMRVNQ